MKLKLLLALILSAGTLIACSHNEDKSVNKNENTAVDSANKVNSGNTDEANTQEDNPEKAETDSKEDPEANNKMGLSIGDSAVYKHIIGTYKVTLESAKLLEQLGDEKPFNDIFVKMQIKITNVGKTKFTVADIFDPVLFAGDLQPNEDQDNDNGVPNIAYGLGQKDDLMNDGTNLEPGESTEGVLAFDTYTNTFYTLGFFNDYEELEGKASWKVTKEEME
ncbi:hypothetical protein JOD43_001491 [Pullulanibacillus pueri]|uniref:hypothetical protein n=1 Tax=Pullulanibacillus pueri TaxID=1437324 RepID=UPI001664BAFD|nr:hypothetical protein [Pullulanibacillus pueri]MBM7681324.1 hypothetical protein [Pullulanibacillus pueri]